MQMVGQNERAAAKDYFMSFLKSHPDNQAAYVELYSCADSTTIPDLIGFFNSSHPQGPKIQKLLLANLYLEEGRTDSAAQVNDEVIVGNPNTALAAKAELSNLYIKLYNDNDLSGALKILNRVRSEAKLLEGTELSDAEGALATYVDPETGSMPYRSKEQSTLTNAAPVNDLTQNYPNPFNPTTTISYDLRKGGRVTLKVYDVLGRNVKTLVDGYQVAGLHSAQFNGATLASGVYFYRLTTPTYSKVMKMLMVK